MESCPGLFNSSILFHYYSSIYYFWSLTLTKTFVINLEHVSSYIFIHPFIHSTNVYWQPYYVLDSNPGARDRAVNERGKSPCPCWAYLLIYLSRSAGYISRCRIHWIKLSVHFEILVGKATFPPATHTHTHMSFSPLFQLPLSPYSLSTSLCLTEIPLAFPSLPVNIIISLLFL